MCHFLFEVLKVTYQYSSCIKTLLISLNVQEYNLRTKIYQNAYFYCFIYIHKYACISVITDLLYIYVPPVCIFVGAYLAPNL